MSEWSEQELNLLRNIVTGAEMKSVLEDMDNALGWVVITTEHEINRVRIYGLFDEPAAALECAAAAERVHIKDLGDDEDDWSVQVYPLLPP